MAHPAERGCVVCLDPEDQAAVGIEGGGGVGWVDVCDHHEEDIDDHSDEFMHVDVVFRLIGVGGEVGGEITKVIVVEPPLELKFRAVSPHGDVAGVGSAIKVSVPGDEEP